MSCYSFPAKTTYEKDCSLANGNNLGNSQGNASLQRPNAAFITGTGVNRDNFGAMRPICVGVYIMETHGLLANLVIQTVPDTKTSDLFRFRNSTCTYACEGHSETKLA